jgi:predicted ester cyclase
MRRSAALLMTLALALVTGIVLFRAGNALTGSPEDATAAGVNRALVLRFYDAVNASFETGLPPHFDRLLSDDFVERAVQPEATLDRAGLERYVLDLHAAMPTLRLTVEDLAAQGDEVVARVRVDGPPVRMVLGVPSANRPPAWSTVDFFRIRDGRIVEHRGLGTSHGLAQPLLTASLTVAPLTRSDIAVARITFQSGAGMPETSAPGPTMIVVEVGLLTVRSTRPMLLTRVAPDGVPLPPQETVPDVDVALLPSHQLVIPAATPYVLRNETDAATVALGAIVSSYAAGGSAYIYEGSGAPARPIADAPAPPPGVAIFLPPPRASGDAGPVPAYMVPSQGSAPATGTPNGTIAWPPGVAVQPLAHVTGVTMPDGPAVFTVDRLILPPGAGGPSESVVGLEVVVVEAGRLISDGIQATPETAGGFGPGDARSFDPGTTRAIRNTGAAPLVILVVAITPA